MSVSAEGPPSRLEAELARFSMLAGRGAAVLGAFVFAGWAFDVEVLKSVVPGLVAMKVNTALCFMLSGVALELLRENCGSSRRRRLAAGLTMGVLALGGVTLAEYLLGRNLGIDEMIFREPRIGGIPLAPGRTTPMTAASFVLIGAALALLARNSPRAIAASQAIAVLAGFNALLPLTGYLYGVAELIDVSVRGASPHMAAHSALAFQILSLGILSARPRAGYVATITSGNAGGVAARRLLPFAVFVPLAVGWIRIHGQLAGLYGSSYGLAISATLNVVVFTIVIFLSSRSLNRAAVERGRAEDALRESEERLRLALDAAQMGTFDWDMLRNRIAWSRSHEELWGFGPGEFDGTYEAFAQRLHPGDVAGLNAEMARCLAARAPFVHEFRVVWTDGSIHWIASRGEFAFNPDGQPARMRGAVLETTVRKKAEESLRASEERYHALFEYAPDGIVIADSKFHYVDANASICRMLGYSRGEFIGMHASEIIARMEFEPLGPALELIKPRSDTQPESQLRRKDGSVFAAEIIATVMPDGSLLAMIRDVTERKRTEEALREAHRTLEQRVAERTAQLEAANRSLELADRHKSEFLAGMSHELRTPLNAILGFTGTLLMKLPGPLNTDQEKQLRTVQTSAKHLLSLINDLLDLAKIESGKRELHLEPVSGQKVVEEVLAALRPLAAKKGLRLDLAMPREDVSLHTDRRALSQILINLISNAIKFTAEGRIAIELAERNDEGRVLAEFRVIDTGPGISREDQAGLFGVFTQGRSRGAQRIEGSGLGLHLSQNLASLLGGRIVFESEPGKGSTFTVILPAKDDQAGG